MRYIVALAEVKSVNRNSFLQKINLLGNMQVVFVANDGMECLEQLKGLPVAKHPLVIFMNLEMPKLNG